MQISGHFKGQLRGHHHVQGPRISRRTQISLVCTALFGLCSFMCIYIYMYIFPAPPSFMFHVGLINSEDAWQRCRTMAELEAYGCASSFRGPQLVGFLWAP